MVGGVILWQCGSEVCSRPWYRKNVITESKMH